MTDVEKDLFTMCGYANGLNSSNYWQARGLVGYPNSYFEPIYAEIGTGWDSGYCCSEIACCFSYIAGNLSKIFVAAWADGLVNLYRAAGRFYTNNPMPGDFIFFQYGSGTAEHTGRVAGIENGIIYTVEGNVGGGVRVLTYAVNDWTIYGYGRPDYTGQQIDTYDIKMPDPFHNFVANDIVVHNCGKSMESMNLALYNKKQNNFKHCLIICCINSSKYNWVKDIQEHTRNEYTPYILGSRYLKKKKTKGAYKVAGRKEKFSSVSPSLVPII